MEYSERSFVEGGFDRKLTFPDVKWLSKAKFEAVLKEGSVSIQPCLNSCYEEHDEPICDSRMYVGKSIPKQPPDIDENHNIRTSLGDIRLASFHYLELIGNVLLREDYIDEPETNRRRRKSTWVLRITHNGHTHDIEDDFLVLHIADARTYFWSPSYDTNTLPNGQVITFPKNAVPNFAFRAAFNRLDHKYNYIGRMLTNSKTNSSGSDQQQIQPLCNQRLKFYANAWVSFEDGSNNSGVKYSFGRIGRSQRLLFVPYRNIEVGLDCFETLCLKASPASLKTLCRSIVRANLNKSQECIKSLEPSIPRTLLDFIKYPVNLKLGEFLQRGEKLVAEDGRSEMWIDEANDELILKDTEGRLITLGRGFDIVCVHKFHLIFYDLMNSRVFQSHAFYDANRFYRFTGEWNKQSWKIEL